MMNNNGCIYVVEIKGEQYVEYKAYERRINDLCRQIEELESELEVKENLLKIKNGLLCNKDDLSTDPIEFAQMLINATYERETNAMERAFYKCGDTETVKRYSINDLEQIAEHLLVYCKHNREDE